MRTHAAAALFVTATALAVLAMPAGAVPIIVNADTTISSNATGDDGATGLDDAVGFLGGGAVIWDNTNVDVSILTGFTFTGGVGGLGGPDVASNGGNQGGWGGAGFLMPDFGGTVTASGIFVYGGSGGNGSDGDAGGASDTTGGDGGTGGYGINAFNDALQVTLTNTIVTGASGGTGGAAGDAGGDAGDDTQGGAGGYGGIGIAIQGLGSTISISGSSVITGGNGGAGGTSLPNATNASGGAGGEGIYDIGTNTIITIGVGSTVQGGDGGAAGTGGSDGSAGADASGVWLQGAGASLTNYGTILGSDSGVQAALQIVEDTSLIDNHGAIGATTGHLGTSIVISGSSTLGILHNRTAGLIAASGPANGAIEIGVPATVTEFVNEGTIIGGSGGYGVLVQGSIGSFTNSGTIQAGNAAGLLILNAGMADVIDNTGGIITNSSINNAAVSIAVDVGAPGILLKGGQIANTGGSLAIIAASQTGNVGIESVAIDGAILFLAADETLNVEGSTLDGDITFATGTNNLNFLSGGTTTLLSNTQFIETNFFSLLEGSSVVSNAVQSDANSSIGQLTTIVNSALTLNEDFWADDEVLNQGTIAIASGKTLTSNVVTGDGTYAFGIADAATVGKIEAQGTGSSIDFTGATFQIVLENPSDNFVAGTNFLLAEDLNGNDIIGVTNGTALLDNSALLTFILYRGDASQIGLTGDLLFAQIGQLLLADIASHGDDPNAIALGAALDVIGLDGNTALDDLMLDLALLGTDAEINAVLDSLLPETDGVAYDIATDAGDQVLDVASRRLDGLRGTSIAALEYKVAGGSNVGLRSGFARTGVEIWGQAFGRIVNQRRHDYNDGYDADGYGFAVGADTPFDGGRSLIGAAFAYGQTGADGNTINRTETDVDSSQIVLYGDHVFDSRTYAKGMLGYGWHQNDIARHDVGGPLGPTVTASYDAWQFTARTEAGRPYKGGANLTLVPHLSANYAYYSPDDYRETDPSAGDAIPAIGGLGLDVKTKSLQSFRLGLGVLARWDVELGGNALLQPELRLNYRRELIGDRFETTSEFIGAPGLASFQTLGVDPPRNILDLGVGALLATAGGVDIRANYDLELKQDYTAHGGYVRASVAF